MSWGVSTVGTAANINDRIDALQAPGAEYPPRDEQLEAAKKVAKDIIASGAIGEGDAYMVGLTGHANDGHKYVTGLAFDTIGVNVAQTSAQAVEQYDTAQANLQ